jgi:hypothetical protein
MEIVYLYNPVKSGLTVEESWRFERHLYSCAGWHFAFFTTDGKRAVNYAASQSQISIVDTNIGVTY